MCVCSTYVVQNHQRPVNTSDGVVADVRLDGGHSGVDEFGRHGGRRRRSSVRDHKQRRVREVRRGKGRERGDASGGGR